MRLPKLPNITMKQLLKELYAEIIKDDVLSLSGQMAYFFLFALFPMMLFLVSLLSFLPVEDITFRFLDEVKRVAPAQFYDLVNTHVTSVVFVKRPGLLSLGAFIALYSASAGVSATIDSLNRAYGVTDRRSFFKLKGLAILLTAGASILILLATVLIMGGDAVAAYITNNFGTLGSWYAIGWKVMQWLLAPSAILLALAVLYYFGPDVKQQWKWVTPGSIVATVLWLLTTVGFSYYVSNFGNYEATYGSLGGVMVAMLWLYISSMVILVGGELNAVLEHASVEGKDEGERAPGAKDTDAVQQPGGKIVSADEIPTATVSGAKAPPAAKTPPPPTPRRKMPGETTSSPELDARRLEEAVDRLMADGRGARRNVH